MAVYFIAFEGKVEERFLKIQNCIFSMIQEKAPKC